MKNRFVTYLMLMACMLFASGINALDVVRLRCEYRDNPLGVDNRTPRLSWELLSTDHDVLQTAYQVMVSADSMQLLNNRGAIWDSKKVNSSQSIQLKYKGQPLVSAKKYYWKVRAWDNKGKQSGWSTIHSWQMGLLEEMDWLSAAWIGYEELPATQKIIPAAHGNGDKSWGKRPDILPLFRKVFAVTKKVKAATMFVSGLGQFELFMNGKKAGDHFLDPGWTNYAKSALYVSFDVTSLLQNGSNVVGVMLGNGFYYVPGERYRKLTGAFGYPKMICRLLVEYSDGSTINIVSDKSWKTTAGPIFFSSIYGGESYDANMDPTGWKQAGFNDASWRSAIPVEPVPMKTSQTMAPVKFMDTLTPVSVTKVAPAVFVYDMGQNASAIPWIELNGKRGDTIKIIPGELLQDNGFVSQRSSGGPYFFSYVLKGDTIETWRPQFSYYGFRYLQIENIQQATHVNNADIPVMHAVKAFHLHADYPETGHFTCSNELFNQTATLIDWAIRSNMQSVFTDCPHRERLGWQEQLHLMGPSFHYHYNIASYGEKLMTDIGLAQQTNGLIPSTVPEYTEMHFADGYFRDSPEWGSSGIIMPWNLYRWYGDSMLLWKSYPLMKAYLQYLEEKDSADLLMYGLSDWYDIGPERSGFSQLTPMGLTATATYYHDLIIMKLVAGMLHKPIDSIGYSNKAASVKQAFNKEYYNEDSGQYGTGSQASNAMAVYMDLVAPEHKQAVIDNIVSELKSHDYKLTAGDIGYRYLLRVLEASGNDEIIYKMNNRSDVPGYGYQIAKGATALTEAWDASPNVSNNHFMLGHILEWFYSGLAGIRQQENSVAYHKILIAPAFDTEVDRVSASYRSHYGVISSSWSKREHELHMQVSVPVNTTAQIILPYKPGAVYLVNDKKQTIQTANISGQQYILNAGSGHYRIYIQNVL